MTYVLVAFAYWIKAIIISVQYYVTLNDLIFLKNTMLKIINDYLS